MKNTERDKYASETSHCSIRPPFSVALLSRARYFIWRSTWPRSPSRLTYALPARNQGQSPYSRNRSSRAPALFYIGTIDIYRGSLARLTNGGRLLVLLLSFILFLFSLAAIVARLLLRNAGAAGMALLGAMLDNRPLIFSLERGGASRYAN